MSSLKNLNFRNKLILLIGTATLGMIFGLMSYLSISRVRVGGPLSNELRQQLDLRADLSPPTLGITAAQLLFYRMSQESDREKLQAEINELRAFEKANSDARERWAKDLPAGKLKEVIAANVNQPAVEYLDFVEEKGIPALVRQDRKRVEEIRRVLSQIAASNQAGVREADRLVAGNTLAINQRAQQAVSTSLAMLIGGGIMAAVLVYLLGILIARGILRPLSRILRILQALATGDLRHTVDVDSRDEIGVMGEALNKAMGDMANAIQSIATTAEHVASASEEISSSAAQQAHCAETQNDQAAQVATAMQEMSATVTQVSDNSVRAADAARKAAETAKHGGNIVEETLVKMRVIANSVSSTAKKVGELGRSSDQIGRIIGVIDDIADQTNLLALNAAIEAARAGEQGRGFAVVADEVRKLAERTTSATKEIAQMIKNIQDETRMTVSAMEAGRKEVEEGVLATAQAGHALKEIIMAADQVGEMITHIATAATQQSSASEQVNNNMDEIAKLVKESADGARQSAKACQDLSELALDLQNMVCNFKLEDGSKGFRMAGHQPGARMNPEAAKALAAAAR